MSSENSRLGRRCARIFGLIALIFCSSAIIGCDGNGRFSFLKDPQKAKDEANREKLVGTWVAWHEKTTEVLTFREDGTFHYILGGQAVANFSGKWTVSGLNVDLHVEKFVDGDRKRIGNHLQYNLEKIESSVLILGGANKNTTYTRQPEVKTSSAPAEESKPDAQPQSKQESKPDAQPKPEPKSEHKPMPEPQMPEPRSPTTEP